MMSRWYYLCCVHSHVWHLQPIACQAPLSMWFSRQEYWSGLPFLSPGDLQDPDIETRSPALQSDTLPIALQGKVKYNLREGNQFSSISQSCQTLYDTTDYSTPGFPVHHQLLELLATVFCQVSWNLALCRHSWRISQLLERKFACRLLYPLFWSSFSLRCFFCKLQSFSQF